MHFTTYTHLLAQYYGVSVYLCAFAFYLKLEHLQKVCIINENYI